MSQDILWMLEKIQSSTEEELSDELQRFNKQFRGVIEKAEYKGWRRVHGINISVFTIDSGTYCYMQTDMKKAPYRPKDA